MNYYPKDKEFQRYAQSEFNVSGTHLDLYSKGAANESYANGYLFKINGR